MSSTPTQVRSLVTSVAIIFIILNSHTSSVRSQNVSSVTPLPSTDLQTSSISSMGDNQTSFVDLTKIEGKTSLPPTRSVPTTSAESSSGNSMVGRELSEDIRGVDETSKPPKATTQTASPLPLIVSTPDSGSFNGSHSESETNKLGLKAPSLLVVLIIAAAVAIVAVAAVVFIIYKLKKRSRSANL